MKCIIPPLVDTTTGTTAAGTPAELELGDNAPAEFNPKTFPDSTT